MDAICASTLIILSFVLVVAYFTTRIVIVTIFILGSSLTLPLNFELFEAELTLYPDQANFEIS